MTPKNDRLAAASLALIALGTVACGHTSGTPVAPSPASNSADVQRMIERRLDSLAAHGTFYAKQLSSGRDRIRADEPMNTASVIKIPVMILAFRDADAGRLNLSDRTSFAPKISAAAPGCCKTSPSGCNRRCAI